MSDKIRKHGLAWATLASIALSACGGGSDGDRGGDTPTVPPPAPAPAPALTYTPDAAVCAWVTENVTPFSWPVQSIGPRNWPSVQIKMATVPKRNAEGLIEYTVRSNLWVLQNHYAPQIEAKGLAYSSSQLWAQEASCKYGFDVVDASNLTELSHRFRAYMPDSIAARVAQEEYTEGVEQTDLCRPGPLFPTTPRPTLPPECSTEKP